MNRLQRMACFNLIVIAICLGLCAGAITVLALVIGLRNALGGFVFIGFAGIMLISPFIFPKDKGSVRFDERDELIQKRAVLVGFAASYCFFIAVCVITWLIVGIDGSVSVNMLPIMVCGGFITYELGRSVAILIQYGWGNKDNE